MTNYRIQSGDLDQQILSDSPETAVHSVIGQWHKTGIKLGLAISCYHDDSGREFWFNTLVIMDILHVGFILTNNGWVTTNRPVFQCV